MEINDNLPNGTIKWTGSKEEFIEFVLIVADYRICANNQSSDSSKRYYYHICDVLGDDLIRFFKMDISPHENFKQLRENTTINYRFTKRIIRIMKRLKQDEYFLHLLEERGILPSVEYITEELIKWNNIEKITTLLWLYINKR